MGKRESIKHKGVVRSVRPGLIEVEVVPESGCGSCRAKEGCFLAEARHKVLDISMPGSRSGFYSVGETVNVLLKPAQRPIALLFGFILPSVLFLIALFMFTAVYRNELKAGLTALGILVPYYLSLMLFQGHMKKMFVFELEKWTPVL